MDSTQLLLIRHTKRACDSRSRKAVDEKRLAFANRGPSQTGYMDQVGECGTT